jgi:transposase
MEYNPMLTEKPPPSRFFGLDIHKHYLVAMGVDPDGNQLYGPRKVNWADLETWRTKTLTVSDAVVIEMTTNTWQVYDDLLPHVHSITVVHPPHVKSVTQAQVMTDRIAALNLAKLLAKGLLVSIWIPPTDVRDRRALVAQRNKMTRLATQAKNRLHAVLHRYHLAPPAGDLFAPEQAAWWLARPVAPLEKVRIQSDLDTLAFAQVQITNLEAALATLAAQEDRLIWLVQLPGVGWLTALVILAAIGDITRFPDAKHLVGYAGLGARIHDSGLTTRTGKITKAGRRDLRAALVEAAQTAANTHPHWQAELARREPRLGRNKAIVAIARKLLVAVWHVLTEGCADCHAEPERVARKLMQVTYRLGKNNRPAGRSTAALVRVQLDRLEIGKDLKAIPWSAKKKPIPLPPSTLPPD